MWKGLAWVLFLPLLIRPSSSERFMVIGNSITRHPPREEIGWYGDWGMAASEQQKDWVHLVREELLDSVTLRIEHCTAPSLAGLTDELVARVQQENPTILVIQLGDNMPPEDATAETLREPVVSILQAAQHRKIVVGTWGADDIRNQLLKQAAQDGDAIYIRIDDIRSQPGAQAWDEYENAAVGWHPSDLGMALIADRVLAALQ